MTMENVNTGSLRTGTKFFGQVAYEPQDVLHFAKGLFAFEEERDFLLLPFADSDGVLLCLQSLQTEGLAFMVINPFLISAAYEPKLSEEELSELGVNESGELSFYILCAVKQPVGESTLNLKCPVAINVDTKAAMQVILEGDRYSMRERLADFGKPGERGEEQC